MPAGKTYTRIASQTTTGSVQTVTFSNLPQNFTDLVCVMQVVSSSSNTLFMRFNSNTGSNYSVTRLSGSGTSAVCDRGSNATYGSLSNYAYPTSTAGNTNTILQIPNYSNTTTNKTFLVRSNSAGAGVDAIVGLWRQTSAINSISFSTNGFTSSTSISSGSIFTLYGIECAKNPKATGGNTIVNDGTYWYHTFTSSGSFIPNATLTADVLLVAGGGGTGSSAAGGGGAGGILYSPSTTLGVSQYSVTVGAGGSPYSSGGNSTFTGITTALGGGFGGAEGSNGNAGGSGGGAGTISTPKTGGASTQTSSGTEIKYGNAGGNSSSGGAGGGGGSATAGGAGSGDSGGNGGVGTSAFSSWGLATGTGQNSGGTVYYAGGGGGYSFQNTTSSGGLGGGGNGMTFNPATAPTSATANTGGGAGGGTGTGTPASGGSGIVIVRYPI